MKILIQIRDILVIVTFRATDRLAGNRGSVTAGFQELILFQEGVRTANVNYNFKLPQTHSICLVQGNGGGSDCLDGKFLLIAKKMLQSESFTFF